LPLAIVLAAAYAGCAKGDGVLDNGALGGLPGSGKGGASGATGAGGNGVGSTGEALYGQLCATCHGAKGEGGIGPSLRGWGKGEPALVSTIATTMPKGNVGKCTGTCASGVAAYILANFQGQVVCTGAPTSIARGLRLLNRREYLATVTDLLTPASSAGAPASCPVTFTWSPAGKTVSKVHVAGTFNGWPSTIAGGGWAMALDAGKGTYATTYSLPPGTYQYKLVLDESQWITDPANSKTAPDGLGGQNSVLSVACSGSMPVAALPFDPTDGFGPDTRPDGFAFDDHGPTRVVSSEAVSAYHTAAAKLAGFAAPGLGALLSCNPASDTKGCTDALVGPFATRALRRPPTDAEAQRYRTLITSAADFTTGAQLALRAILTSPAFLYRSEIGTAQADGTSKLTPWEIASALSYQLTGSLPDAELSAAAASGALSDPATLEKQARRLLATPRARDIVGIFATEWLAADGITDVVKNDGAFPGLTPAVRAAMLEETRRFVTHVIFDGTHQVGELFTAKYTFANPTLAAYYGLAAPAGGDFAQVSYPDDKRAGILGHGSVLATTAHSDQTSPIRRGLLVRRSLLCQQFGKPPANAGGVPKVDPNATTKERFSQHSSDPACSGCHKEIDPIGFGFERFDPIGKIRDTENGKPIDTTGDMLDVEALGAGTSAPFSTMAQLGQTLADSHAAKACFARQYYRFSHGVLEPDSCALGDVLTKFEQSNWDVRELMVAIVTSPGFVVRKQ
jgi:hypothetical protein